MSKTGVEYKGKYFTYDDKGNISSEYDLIKNDGFDKKAILRRAESNIRRSPMDSDRDYYKKLISFILDERRFLVFASSVKTRVIVSYDLTYKYERTGDRSLYDTSQLKKSASSIMGWLSTLSFFIIVLFGGALSTNKNYVPLIFIMLLVLIGLGIWGVYLRSKKELTDKAWSAYEIGFDAKMNDTAHYLDAAKEMEDRYNKSKS